MEQNFKQKFKEKYLQLNAEQKRGVDQLSGPVMVIAGPGTGKTFMLTMRIAHILDKTDTPPEAILALTFTESAVVSMRRALAEIIGSAAYRVNIATYHSFANDIIKSYPDAFGQIMEAQNILEVDQITIIRQILDGATLETLKPFSAPYFYVRSIIGSIGELKRQGLTPETFLQMLNKEEAAFLEIEDLYHQKGVHKGKMKGKYGDMQKELERNKELAMVYGAYQQTLKKQHAYDFSDMIMQAMLVLQQNSELKLSVQEKYLYILVDEHQDTNSAQNKILELLCDYDKNPNLFIVGDEKQAIYRFQGASMENFLYFKKLYPGIELIELKNNYRSTQSILDVALDLHPRSTKLIAKAGQAEVPITFFSVANEEAEYYFVAQEIKKIISQGVEPSQIALLYRENKDVIPFARVLEKLGIGFAIESDQDTFADPEIKKLLVILKAVQHFGSEPELAALLHVDVLGLEPLDVYKFLHIHRLHKKVSLYDALKNQDVMKEAGIEDSEKFCQLFTKLSFWSSMASNQNAIQAFEYIVRDSGFLAQIIKSPDAAQILAKLHTIFDQMKSLIANHKEYTLLDFFNYLDVLQEHDVAMKTHVTPKAPGKIRCMTSHKSKGLEFEYVFVVGARYGHWGNKRHHQLIKLPASIYSLLDSESEALRESENDDERNVFYVALTRAKKQLAISYSKTSQDGRDQLPSIFIEEIKSDCLKKVEFASDAIKVLTPEILFSPSLLSVSTIQEKAFLQSLFLDHGLSVTGLNNYLTCPWQYFYRNLIRIPEAPNKNMIFGSAIHAALKSYFDSFVAGADPDKEYLLARFFESLAGYPLQDQEYRETLAKGRLALSGYYDQYHDTWNTNMLSEFDIHGIELEKNVVINGKIDKIELLPGSGNVKVVDFKTGKPKSRNELEGKTKDSDGNYKRQLIFYRLLLDNYQDGKYHMRSGEIDFVEPDAKGNYKKEVFEITPQEITDLKDEIKKVSQEILDLSFWNRTCDDKECQYCKLRKMM